MRLATLYADPRFNASDKCRYRILTAFVGSSRNVRFASEGGHSAARSACPHGANSGSGLRTFSALQTTVAYLLTAGSLCELKVARSFSGSVKNASAPFASD